jgi:hypothetical protein
MDGGDAAARLGPASGWGGLAQARARRPGGGGAGAGWRRRGGRGNGDAARRPGGGGRGARPGAGAVEEKKSCFALIP